MELADWIAFVASIALIVLAGWTGSYAMATVLHKRNSPSAITVKASRETREPPVEGYLEFEKLPGLTGAIDRIQIQKGQIYISGTFYNLPGINHGDNLGRIKLLGDDFSTIYTQPNPFISDFSIDPNDTLTIEIGLVVYQYKDDKDRWVLAKH